MMWTDELALDWIAHLTPSDSATTVFLNQARSALIQLGESREHLAQARAAFVGLGDSLSGLPNAGEALRELGVVIETISAAANLLERGLKPSSM